MIAASFEQVALAKAEILRTPHAAGTGFVEANDNTLPLRVVFYRTVRLAGRLALTQLRSVVQSSRTKTTALGSNSFDVVKRIPRAVCEVSYSRPFMSCVPINFGTVRPVLIATGR